MTHSLEVSQVARTIGRALRLNEDLIEAIALGHDLGHTPFGHAGEHALDAALKEFNGPITEFRHDLQSLRIVDVLEHLNLSQETRAGIGGHSKGRNDLSAHDGMPTSTLEAAVVRISDRIAYLSHDIDDAVRAGIIDAPPQAFEFLGTSSRERIGRMVMDVIEHSLDVPAIRMSPALIDGMNGLKEWMFENVYNEYPVKFPDIPKAQNLVKELFAHFAKEGALAEGYEGLQGAIDYLAGMTDRFAMDTYARLKMPSVWQLA